MQDPYSAERIDDQLKNLRSKISDLGHEVDSSKTKTAAAMGGGGFLLLLAAGACYDLVAGKSGVWSTLGVSRGTLMWIAIALGTSSLILLAAAFARVRQPHSRLQAELDRAAREYAELLESQGSVPHVRP